METDVGALEAYRRYAEAFQALDPGAVAAHFHEPALTVSSQGVVAFPTVAAAEQFYRRVMADLPAQGYARTEFTGLAERPLAAGLALVTGAGTWKKASGEELRRFGFSFTLRRTGDGWRIAVAIFHDAV